MGEMRVCTVLLSIHQPDARIDKMFDSVLLLAIVYVMADDGDQLRSLLVDAVELSIDSDDALRAHSRITGADDPRALRP